MNAGLIGGELRSHCVRPDFGFSNTLKFTVGE
jgi:hypothetical protein